jgi:hypothetical protein
MVMVSISSVGGGRPEAGLSDREIHHLVSRLRVRKTLCLGENRAIWRVMAAFCVVTLM